MAKGRIKGRATRAFLSLLLICALLSPLVLSVSAVPAFPDTSNSEAVYLFNFEHERVLFSKGGDKALYPASLTKIMTGLVALELVGDRLDESVTVTSDMLRDKNGTSMELRAGDVLSYRDLLYGVICGGFNDAACVLASASAGSVSAFVKKMNEKAEALGARDTHFTNPTGWHSEEMVSTLYDLSLIAKEAAKNELYLEISSEASHKVEGINRGAGYTVHNRNGLIGSFYAIGYYNKRAKGLIAGKTDEGGNCLATTFSYDGLSYLLIIMGARDVGEQISSYTAANEIISHTINYYGNLMVIEAGDTVAKVPVHLALSRGDEDFYMLRCTVPEDVSVFAEYDTESLETLELRPYFFSDVLSAPIKAGERLGGIDIFIDGKLCGNAPLVAANDVEANAFLSFMTNAKKMLVSRPFIIFAIVFVVLFTIYFFTHEVRAMQKKNKKIKIDRIF